LGRTKQTKSFEGGTTWSFKDTNYDALGRAYQVSNPYRTTPTEWTTTTFDGAGRVTAVTSPDNAVVSTAYNGNQVVVSDQAGKKRMSETDGLGRLMKVWEITPTDAQTVAVSFPGQSFNAGYLTTYSYDTLDNLMTVNQAAQTRSFVYDSLKRLKSATNPESGTTTYSYDNNSNLYQKTDALGLIATYTYDNLNRNTTIGYSSYTNGTAFVDIHYDSAPLGKGKFHYNSKYNTESNGTFAYNYDFINSYDAAGRPTSKSQNFLVNQGGWAQKAFTTTATYDLAGNVLSQTYPSGRAVNYAYDVAARQISVSGKLGGITGAGNTDLNYATGINYTAAGLLAKETFGTTTALYHRNNYNVRQQLFAVRVGTEGATTYDNDPLGSYYNQGTAWDRGILNWHYGNNDFGAWGTSGTNNNGNVLRAHSWIPGAGVYVDDYEYDALNRITKDTGNYNATYVQAFDYDRFGNRTINQSLTTNVDINKKLFSVNTANNRLGVPTGQTGAMNYDAVGNLIFDSYTNPGKIEAMTYDAENHMTSAANGGHQYRYNAEGKRVKRIIAGQGEFWMVYGIGGELVAEYNATSSIPLQTSPNKEYGYRSGQLLVVWDDTETTANQKLKWLVTDQLGSTRMEIGRDGAASAVTRHDYLPFGEELGGTKRSGNGYGAVTKTKQKFTSKQRDEETGLDFFEARFMSSVQGRFTGADPKNAGATTQNPQSWSAYTYVLNRPTTTTDSKGKAPDLEVERQQNGTYTVTGGTQNDDRTIHIMVGGQRTGTLGTMLTPWSFFNDDATPVIGASINVADQTGVNYLNNEVANAGPSSFPAFGPDGALDFKARGDNPQSKDNNINHHRGMPIGEGLFASARDVGNAGAGYAAANNGMPRYLTRKAFDVVDHASTRSLRPEGQPSRQAQQLGYNAGAKARAERQATAAAERRAKVQNVIKKVRNIFGCGC
jgi:RHS repeat-associated protein